MYGKTAHSEAAGNVMLAERRILRDPQAQTFCQDQRLLHSSFRHQDDEFVSAITRHHVRLPALLLQQPAHACQHQVALEMALGVVHSLELVQIHQHHRDWPPGARGALQFRTQGFKEEAPRLDSGKPVGDGLLLQFLKYECIVQSGCQQVGEGVHDQPVLRQESVFFQTLHIQHAHQAFAVGNRNAEHGACSRHHSLQLGFARGLYQRSFSGARDAPQNAQPERNAFSQACAVIPASAFISMSLVT